MFNRSILNESLILSNSLPAGHYILCIDPDGAIDIQEAASDYWFCEAIRRENELVDLRARLALAGQVPRALLAAVRKRRYRRVRTTTITVRPA